MSELWNVSCASRTGKTVTLEVHQAHPDAGELIDSAVFALRALADGAGSLMKDATWEKLYDDSYMATHIGDFVVAQRFELVRRPLDRGELNALLEKSGVAEEDMEDAYDAAFDTGEHLGLARYEVTMVSERWIDPEAGKRWGSAADPPRMHHRSNVVARGANVLELEVRRGGDADMELAGVGAAAWIVVAARAHGRQDGEASRQPSNFRLPAPSRFIH